MQGHRRSSYIFSLSLSLNRQAENIFMLSIILTLQNWLSESQVEELLCGNEFLQILRDPTETLHVCVLIFDVLWTYSMWGSEIKWSQNYVKSKTFYFNTFLTLVQHEFRCLFSSSLCVRFISMWTGWWLNDCLAMCFLALKRTPFLFSFE